MLFARRHPGWKPLTQLKKNLITKESNNILSRFETKQKSFVLPFASNAEIISISDGGHEVDDKMKSEAAENTRKIERPRRQTEVDASISRPRNCKMKKVAINERKKKKKVETIFSLEKNVWEEGDEATGIIRWHAAKLGLKARSFVGGETFLF